MKNQFDEYIKILKNQYNNAEDFVLRTGGNGGRFAVAFIRGISDRSYIAETIIRPLLKNSLSSFSGDFSSLLECNYLKTADDALSSSQEIARGGVLVIIESQNGFFAALSNAQSSPDRSINEPGSDITLKGPKAGFVENAETNMGLLRRIIRTPSLKFQSFTLGQVSKTNVILTYVEGRASKRFVKEISQKLSSISANVITDSTNVIMLIKKRGISLFPTFGSTEKVEKAASKLMAGRVGIIVDGSPFLVTLPFLFVEGFQSSDDYLHTGIYATFIRILRFISFFSAIFGPAILCGIVSRDSTVIPPELYGLIDEARQDIPITFFWEILVVLILFEILREVGVRMPRTVGDAVGIVGSVILGNTAVEAGIVSSVGVITVAFSAVCAFITPAYMYVIVLWRLLSLVLTELFGFVGFALSAISLFSILLFKKSWGVPYTTPLCPFGKAGAADTVIALPKRVLGRRERLGKHKK